MWTAEKGVAYVCGCLWPGRQENVPQGRAVKSGIPDIRSGYPPVTAGAFLYFQSF